MRFPIFAILMVLTAHGATGGSQEFSDADAILGEVVARLPAEPLLITGDLTIRRPRGVPVQQLRFDMHLRWGQSPPIATYVIRDAFGRELEAMDVVRQDDGTAHFVHKLADAAAGPVVGAAPPAPIQQSDLTWTDLSLSFLWWRQATLVGEAEVKGRACLIIDIPSPEMNVDSPPDGQESYARVRVWVDREMLMLLRAEGYGRTGTLLRSLWVHSFKKIDERWMIKDMEIQSYPILHRTKLRIQEVRTGKAS